MRILVLSTAIPFPPIGGGRLRSYELLSALIPEHTVTPVGFSFGETMTGEPPIRIIAIPWEMSDRYAQMMSSDAATSKRAYVELAGSAEPWFVSYFASEKMEEAVRALHSASFDLVILEGTAMGRFLPCLPGKIPKILNLFDVHTLMAQRAAEQPSATGESVREFERTRQFESAVARQCICSLACSKQEAVAARELLGVERVHIIPNGVDTSYFRPSLTPGIPGYLLFTGTMNYAPNAQAAQHFVRNIFPMIRREMPSARFHIVGAHPTRTVSALASGYVPDIRPHFCDAAVVVVPLLQGGGTRLKILEAAASGKAIVTTSLGAEGLNFCPGKDLLVADDVRDFATAVVSLLRDGQRRLALGQSARRAAAQYDWTQVAAEYRRVIESVATST